MIKNYFRIAWRSLLKRKLHSLFLVSSLAVGFAATFALGNFILGELAVNEQVKNVGNHYLVKSKWVSEGMGPEITTISALAENLQTNYPELIKNHYTFDGVSTNVQNGDKVFKESLQLGSASIFDMFGFSLLHGNPKTALTQPDVMVISQKTAMKYFGKTDVVNQFLDVASFSGEKRSFKITGVLGDISQNSVTHLVTDELPILMSEESLRFFNRYNDNWESWSNTYLVSFVELQDGVTADKLQIPLQKALSDNAPKQISESLTAVLSPLKSLYLDNDNGFHRKNIYTLMFIGLLTLVMVVVNFVNTFIGNASERLREVGVRKSLGGRTLQLSFQFVLEAILISSVSFLLALGLYFLLNPLISEALGKQLPDLSQTPLLLVLSGFGFALSVGILSALYPSLKSVNTSVTTALKNKVDQLNGSSTIRKSLTVIQFAVALFILGATIVITRQINFVFEKDMGYEPSGLLYVSSPRDWSPAGTNRMLAAKEEFKKLPLVENSTLSYEIPDGRVGQQSALYLPQQGEEKAVQSPLLQVDESYADTYGINLAAGSFFDASEPGEPEIILNESAVKALGFEDPTAIISELLHTQIYNTDFRIKGVVKDFHFYSVHEQIRPLAFVNVRNSNFFRYLTFKIPKVNQAEAIASLSTEWKKNFPNTAFEYQFIDDVLVEIYASETRLKKASEMAIYLSIFIVLMGVLSTVSLHLVRRTKELGIRQILGASFSEINWLFLREQLVNFIIGSVVAIPAVYFLMKKWLQNFAYQTDLPVSYFLLTIIGFALVVSAIVIIQVTRTIRKNPIKSLQSE
ncbi:MAG: putative ABC transport system permease protein [Spirosomataceae bacterium]|jgi:putative ABC transport system permease protein